MSNLQELELLAQYVRTILPDKKYLSEVHLNDEASIVEFSWHARKFVVTPRLDVFELKGKTLTITGVSQLMQAALRTKDRNSKVVAAVVETIHTAEDNMRGSPDRGLALLAEARKILWKLAGSPAPENSNAKKPDPGKKSGT